MAAVAAETQTGAGGARNDRPLVPLKPQDVPKELSKYLALRKRYSSFCRYQTSFGRHSLERDPSLLCLKNFVLITSKDTRIEMRAKKGLQMDYELPKYEGSSSTRKSFSTDDIGGLQNDTSRVLTAIVICLIPMAIIVGLTPIGYIFKCHYPKFVMEQTSRNSFPRLKVE